MITRSGFRRLPALLAAAVCLGVSIPSRAVPVFARKYGFNCTMCHSNFPRLNDYGQRFRENGYRLPGREDDEKTVLDTPAPVAFRTSVTYNSHTFRNTPGSQDVKQFQMNNLDILSAGLLAPNIGFLVVYPPQIEASRGVVGQKGTLEMASLVFSAPSTTWLRARVGRFEPGALAFSPKRLLTFSPYEVYDFAFPNGTPLSDTQTGIELSGDGRDGTHYAAGWLNGSATNTDNQSAADVYARVTHVFGAGEGQTAGQRLGLMAYLGRARPDATLSNTGRKAFNRLGADLSLNVSHANLALQYLRGRDDRALWGTPGNVTFSGGFAELSLLPATNLVGFARYDWVKTPGSVDADIRRWTGGARFYPADNVALHAEYSHRRQNQQDAERATERVFMVGADFAI